MEPGFRKASDTRPIPEIPKASLTSLRKITGPLTSPPPSAYGPYVGPVHNLPLTSVQASQLLDASGFPRSLEKYRKIFIEEIINRSVKLPSSQRRRIGILLDRAKHPCSRETLLKRVPLGAYLLLEKRIVDPEMSAEDVDQVIRSYASSISIQLVDGFDVVSSTHFIFDKDGNIVNVTKAEENRYGEMCIPYLTSVGLRKAQESQFKQFLKETSDPFKGSQQGTGKTRKQKKHSKKTLRRRKVRRNVH